MSSTEITTFHHDNIVQQFITSEFLKFRPKFAWVEVKGKQRKLNVDTWHHDGADHDIKNSFLRHPRKDPTRRSSLEEAGSAKWYQHPSYWHYLKKISHNKAEQLVLSKTDPSERHDRDLDMQGFLALGFSCQKRLKSVLTFNLLAHVLCSLSILD